MSDSTSHPTMPVPTPDHPCWQKLANGGLAKLRTDHLGTQFLMKNMERSKDPIPVKAQAIHAYFAKWERLLIAELKQLTVL